MRANPFLFSSFVFTNFIVLWNKTLLSEFPFLLVIVIDLVLFSQSESSKTLNNNSYDQSFSRGYTLNQSKLQDDAIIIQLDRLHCGSFFCENNTIHTWSNGLAVLSCMEIIHHQRVSSSLCLFLPLPLMYSVTFYKYSISVFKKK